MFTTFEMHAHTDPQTCRQHKNVMPPASF